MAARMVLWLAASCWYKWFLNLLRSQYIRVYQDYNHRSPSYHKCQHDKIDLECVSSRCSMSHGTVMWPLVFMLSNFYKHVDTFWCFCSRIVFNGCSSRYEGASLAFLSFFFLCKREYIKINEIWVFYLLESYMIIIQIHFRQSLDTFQWAAMEGSKPNYFQYPLLFQPFISAMH